MTESKKIVIDLPDSMLKEFDEILNKDNRNRSEFIMEAIILYIEENKKRRLREKMRIGYKEMSQINLEIAEFGFATDCCNLCDYEARLAECDSIDDGDGEKRRYILC